jgi:uncharacterized protein
MNIQGETRKGDWFQTYTGKKFYPLDSRPDDINIIDIAHALSRIIRGTGHLKIFYSLAEHCLNTYKLLKQQGCNEKIQLIGLLHDACEAYVNDLNSVLKKYLPEYKKIENAIQETIWKAFNLQVTEEEYKIVKNADVLLLSWESNFTMHNCMWNDKEVVLDIAIKERPMDEVKDEFIEVFYKLYSKLNVNK